jgi:hypothetical protein
MAQDEVFEGETVPSAKGGSHRKKDDFEHPFVLHSRPRNGNGPWRME